VAADLKQEGRCLGITTPLGPDVLAVASFSMTEAISRLFSLQLTMVSEQRGIKPEDLVGKPVTLRISTTDESRKDKYVNGIVVRFSQGEADSRVRTYYAEVVPWLWFLTQTSDMRIFQKKSVPDIIQKIFQDLGFTDFQLKLQGTFEPRNYCVQYRETDFAFVSRLMEEEGIFYFFKHDNGKHTLVIGNDSSAHEAGANFGEYRYAPKAGEGEGEGAIVDWRHSQGFRPGKFMLRDHKFQMPDKNLEKSTPSAIKMAGNDKFEVYDYPGGYAKRFDEKADISKIEPDGDRTVKLRIQAEEAEHYAIKGACTRCGMSSGNKFDLKGAESSDQNKAYVITSVDHVGEQSPNYFSGEGLPLPYECRFTCIPCSVPYRPQRMTPKPVVHGLQPALVVGLAGEEIDCDEYGRVRIQFYWDREGKKDQNSSCWVRVATTWGGKQWGMIQIPRIGQEVLVAFMEGDPDQPIIVGSVYNADQMPAYKLPDKKMISGLRSQTTPGGGGYNEISMDDTKGKERMFVQAEYNCDSVVKNNDTLKVGYDKKDPGDQTIEIYNNRTATLEMGNDKLTVKKGNREAVIEMGNDALTIKMGNQTTKLNLGKSETEAMQSIELKVGQSSLKVDQMGVTIKGMMINIEGQVQTQLKGLMTQVSASAILQAKGALTMIG